MVGAVGIELLFNFTKSRVFTVLPTARQMNWSQMELSFASSRNLKRRQPTLEAVGKALSCAFERMDLRGTIVV
jgi:hypothetical protein